MSCYLSACCIASCEPAQIHGSISKMKMEIQKKIWTSRYAKRALTVAFVHTCALKACSDPGIFVKGGPGRWPENSLDNVFFLFFSLQLILQFGFITEKTALFQGSRGGVQLFPGMGVQMLISIEPHITCDFPGGPDPISPLWIRT